MICIADNIVRRGHHAHFLLMLFLNAEYRNLVLCGNIRLPDALANPLFKRRHLIDAKCTRQVNIVKKIVKAVALRPLLRNILIGINHFVRTVSQ